MKPASFDYFCPQSAEEALALFGRFGDDARALAGGQSLMPLINFRMSRPGALIDLNRCADLFYLEVEGDFLVSGPMTRQATAETSPLVRRRCPLLAKALGHMGHPTIRNRGTLGGSIAHADPAAELPAAAMALGAAIVLEGPNGRRTVTPEDFFVDSLVTSIETGEIVRELRFPLAAPDRRYGFAKASVRHADLALAAVAANLRVDGAGRCLEARLVAIGAGPRPLHLSSAEALLEGRVLDEAALSEAAESAVDDIVEPPADLQASADHRRRLVIVMAARALRDALGLEARQ